jgi:putative FmdB family regulatory protein
MPLYEYRCAKCGKTFEVIQKFADAPLAVHEECGGAVERLISAPAFQFKGSGFYITDYAKSGSGSSSGSRESKAESEQKSDAKSDSKAHESKSDSKSESKPAESKSETKSESKPESKPAPAAKSE